MTSSLNTTLIAAVALLACPPAFALPTSTQGVTVLTSAVLTKSDIERYSQAAISANRKAPESSPTTAQASLGKSNAEELTLNERLTLLFSLMAFTGSLCAIKVSRDSRDLALRSYGDDRRVLLRTDERAGASGREGITFRPLEEAAQVNKLLIYFPSILGIEPVALMPPDLTLYSSRISTPLQKYLHNRLGSPASDTATVAPRYPIQVLAVVHGYTRGVASLTTAIYELVLSYVHVDGLEPKAYLKAAVLNNYVQGTGDPQAYIDCLFAGVEKAISSCGQFSQES